MASSSEREDREIAAANASGNTPVVFIHGLWLLPSSWDRWADFFQQAGYAPLTPDWPDDPETVEGGRSRSIMAGARSPRRRSTSSKRFA
jgi:non-heme chloroperoxidase